MQRNLHQGAAGLRRALLMPLNRLRALGVLLLVGLAGAALAQPTVLGTQVVNGTYTTYDLTDFGAFRQVKLTATSAAATGLRTWEFAQGTAASTSYTTNWRPYTASQTLAGYNQYIDPATQPASARYNTGSGGSSGLLPAVVSGTTYTFNITKNATANNGMAVLSTPTVPVAIASVSREPAAPVSSVPVVLTTTFSAVPNAAEYVYVRYSIDNFATSSFVAFSTTATAVQTATIPAQTLTAGQYVRYYVFSSTVSTVATFTSTNVDMLTLNLNNAGGNNYRYDYSGTGAMSGQYYINNGATNYTPGGAGTNFISFGDAFNALNAYGISGAVTFNVKRALTYNEGRLVLNAIQGATAARTITFTPEVTSGNNPTITPSVAGVGSSDGIVNLNGADYVTFDQIGLQESTANTNNSQQYEYGYALYPASPTDGAQYNEIKGAYIFLQKAGNPTAAAAIYAAPQYYGNTTAGNATSPTLTNATGATSFNKINGNIIQALASPALAGAQTGIFLNATTTSAYLGTGNEIGSTTGNTMTDIGGGSGNNVAGIRVEYQANCKIENNNITIPATTTGGNTVSGIGAGSSSATNISGTLTVNNNTIAIASAVTSTVYGIRQAGSTALTTVNITNNKVQNCNFTGATNAVNYITDASSAAGLTSNITGNQVINNTTTTTGTVVYIGRTGSSGTANISGNFIGVTSGGMASANTMTSAGGTTYLIQATTGTITIDNNKLTNTSYSNTSSTTTSTLYGYYNVASPTAETITNNVITNLGIAGASTSTAHSVQGIRLNTIAGDVQIINQNTIGTLSISATGGSGTVTGLALVTGGAAGSSIARNKIYDLSAVGTSGAINGIAISGGGTFPVNNNLIGDLRAPASTNLLAVAGLNITSGTQVNAYHNTVYLNASSTGGTFGTTGIFLNSTTTNLDLRGNLVVNTSTGSGAGNGGYTAALRRSSGTANTSPANLLSTSDYNLYNVGTASATNLLYVEGSATATNPISTLVAYKNLMGSPKEANAKTETTVPATLFASTTGTANNFLHINASNPTQVESGGPVTPVVNNDYDGDLRFGATGYPSSSPNGIGQAQGGGSATDIGADEGTFTPTPQVLTAVTYTQSNLSTYGGQTDQPVTGLTLTTSGGGTALVLNSVVFNLTGTATALDISNAKLYKSPTSTFTVGTATLLATTAVVTAPGSITLTPSTAPSLVVGNNYYFLTFDIPVAGTTNGRTIAAVPTTATVSTVPYNSGSTPAVVISGSPGVRTIVSPLNGTYTVGTAATYPTITAAITDLNLRGVSGPVTFSLINASTTPYSTANGETFPLNLIAYAGSSSTNTVTFKPALTIAPLILNVGTTSTFTVTSAANYVFDGSNTPASTTRDLTISNTSATATAAALVYVASTIAAPSSNIVVKNLVLQGAANTGTSAGVMVSSTTYNTSTGGSANGIVINNNTVQGTALGIVVGNDATTPGTGLQITNNVVGPAVAATATNIGLYGIYANYVTSPAITGNTVQNVVSTTAGVYGLYLVTGTGATVTGNTISGMSGAGASYGLNSAMSGQTIGTNTIGTVSTSSGAPTGMSLTGATNTVTGNTINGVTANGSNDAFGLVLAAGFTGGTVARNKVLNVTGSTGGYSGHGIDVNAVGTTANLTLSNNFVAGIGGTGWTTFTSTTNSGITGIRIYNGTQGGVNLYHNSVNLTGTASYSSTSLVSAALYVGSATTALNVQDNIFVNSINSSANASGPKAYALYSAAANTAFTTLNYNDYYNNVPTNNATQGFVGAMNGTDAQTFAAFKTASGQDANSVTGNPNFTSATDLHIASGATKAESNGTLIAAAGNDVDNQVRGPYPLAAQVNGGGTNPDLGADEGDFTPAPLNDVGITALTAPTATQGCYTAAETVTATLKNFGSTSLNFATYPVTVSGSVTGPANTTLVPVIINTGTLAAGATQAVTFVTTANMSAAGTYTFAISTSITGGDSDATNDALPSTPAGTNTRTVSPLASGTASASASSLCGTSSTVTLTLTGNTGGNVQWQSSTDNTIFTPISGATTNPYTTGAVTQTMYYNAVVSCGASSATSNTVTVTVSNPTVTFVNSPTRCGAGTVTLQATTSTGDTPYYYTTATGGSPFGSGLSATATVAATPSTQTFYVEARNGTLNVTGETSSSSAPSGSVFGTPTFNDYPLGFNVGTAGVLSSVDVYPTATGTLTIRLYSGTNPGAATAVAGSDRTITVAAGQVGTRVTIPLNYSLVAGGYRLSNPTGIVGRYTTYTGTYPITNGAISVVGSYNLTSATSYTSSVYNGFFNLAFASGGTGCASAPRTALNVTVNPATALTYTGSTSYCAGSSTVLTFSPNTYTTLTVTPTTGTTVDNTAHTITFSATASGSYTVTGADANGNGAGTGAGCSATATVAITVNPTPNAPTLTPATPAAYCAGGSTAVAASSNTNSLTNQTILATADFNSGTNSFTTTPAANTDATLGFARKAAPYALGTAATATNGPDNNAAGSFYVVDTDKLTTNVTTSLVSPTFSTVNYTAATLSFQQYYRYISGNDIFAGVEYSTNGTTWTTLVSYTSTQGTATGVQTATTVALPAGALGQASVQIRFRYQSNDGYYWAIDNVGVTGTLNEAPTFAVTVAGNPTTTAAVSGGNITASVYTANITFNPTTTTTYNVTATYPSSSGCPSVATPITITVRPLPTFSTTQTNVSCNGNADGTITVTATGGTAPYQFSKDNGVTYVSGANPYTFTGLAGPATYQVLVKGQFCTAAAAQPVAISQPAVLVASATGTNATCANGADGSISASATGGTTAYQFNLNGGTYQSSGSFVGLAPGTYTIGVKDANNCTASTTVSVGSNNAAATANAGTTPAAVCAGNAYATTGSYGGSATSATYTTSNGTGTFSNSGVINGTTPSVTYTPSAADATAGSVTLTLTTSGPCTAATSMLTLTINSSTTWTGLSSSDWFDGGNWTSCVPTYFTDAIVPTGTLPNQPSISSTTQTATVRGLSIASPNVLSIATGATLDLKGSLTTTVATSLVATGTGMVRFTGTTAQNIGAGTYAKLAVTGVTPKVLSGASTVSNDLDLTSGMLDLTTQNLELTGTASTVTGAAPTHYVIASGAGRLQLDQVGTGTGPRPSAFFPIGTSTSYNPVTLTNAGATDDYLAGVAAGITSSPPMAMSGYVNDTWDIGEGTMGGSDVTLTLQWNAVNEQTPFDRTRVDIVHYVNNKWTPTCYTCYSPATGAAGAGPYTLTRSGYKSFSPFSVQDLSKPLPVVLTRFAATREGTDAVLSWNTASEQNSLGFEVQVGRDGTQFRKLGFVGSTAGRGSTTPQDYNFRDQEAGKAGLRYYRLRQVDADGSESFSPVRTVQFGEITRPSLSAAPNPFRGGLSLTLLLPANAETGQLTLTDIAGRTVRTVPTPALSAGANQLELTDLTGLASGVYYLHLTLPGQAAQHLKVVKE